MNNNAQKNSIPAAEWEACREAILAFAKALDYQASRLEAARDECAGLSGWLVPKVVDLFQRNIRIDASAYVLLASDIKTPLGATVQDINQRRARIDVGVIQKYGVRSAENAIEDLESKRAIFQIVGEEATRQWGQTDKPFPAITDYNRNCPWGMRIDHNSFMPLLRFVTRAGGAAGPLPFNPVAVSAMDKASLKQQILRAYEAIKADMKRGCTIAQMQRAFLKADQALRLKGECWSEGNKTKQQLSACRQEMQEREAAHKKLDAHVKPERLKALYYESIAGEWLAGKREIPSNSWSLEDQRHLEGFRYSLRIASKLQSHCADIGYGLRREAQGATALCQRNALACDLFAIDLRVPAPSVILAARQEAHETIEHFVDDTYQTLSTIKPMLEAGRDPSEGGLRRRLEDEGQVSPDFVEGLFSDAEVAPKLKMPLFDEAIEGLARMDYVLSAQERLKADEALRIAVEKERMREQELARQQQPIQQPVAQQPAQQNPVYHPQPVRRKRSDEVNLLKKNRIRSSGGGGSILVTTLGIGLLND